jgi:peptidyl-prolyl cis-trans isomerase-like protein 2
MGKWTGTFRILYVVIDTLDKLYITHSEWVADFGGAKLNKDRPTFKALPYDYCALTLCPFVTPVCTSEGTVFDLLHIGPYIERHGRNPVTGEPLQLSELWRLHYSKNAVGEYYCPITLKSFTDYSHIVANRQTGNVYSWEAIQRLAEAGGLKDFFTEEPFEKEDLITLQDPKKVESRNTTAYWHVREEERREGEGKGKEEEEEEKERCSKCKCGCKSKFDCKCEKQHVERKTTEFKPTVSSFGKVATSLTSTAMPLKTKPEIVRADEQGRMFATIKTPGKITIRTNFGDLHFELNCNKTPLACYNFLTLARRGYYTGVSFHRLIPGFMIQGGDPTGTGTGGESIYKAPFADEFPQGLSHDRRGMLSMANRGPRTNTSQFFITFAEAPHLDRVHTIFGRMIGGWEVLDRIELVPTLPSARPAKKILIQDVIIVKDPFEEYQDAQNQQTTKTSTRKAEIDPTLMIKRAKAAVNTPTTVGKYIRK